MELKVNRLKDKKADKEELPETRTVTIHPHTHQPSKAEKEEEINMPNASIETVRNAFFRPIKVKKEKP